MVVQRIPPVLTAALAAEWNDSREPSEVATNTYVSWRCAAGHEWDAPTGRRLKGHGCPYCSGKKVLPGVNDLATLRPELAAEWHPDNEKSSSEVVSGSNYMARWRCANGHEWNARVYSRMQGSRCNVCLGRQVLTGENDLATLRPDLAAEWHPDNSKKSSEVVLGSGYMAKWRCALGHEWETKVTARAMQGNGCAVCGGSRILPGFNDFATLEPVLAALWHPGNERLASETARRSDYGATWQCPFGHVWRARVADIVDGHGCPDCASKNFVSRFEREIADYVAFLGVDTETTVRRFAGVTELDIFVPSLNIAIECQGVYWHSERFNSKGAHAAKRAACEELGIRLIQVWEDDWADRRKIVERMLAHKLGVSTEPRIAARSTTARLVTTAEAREFLEANHIQGFTGATHHLALEHDGRLVALMSLKRTGKSGELRLERYATAAHVLGGQSKLIRYAERAIPGWSHLLTFADHEVSDGSLYERTGWVKDGELAPDYKYRVGSRREHKFNYRLARFRSDPALKFEKGLSERQLAQLNGLDRIWDSGKTRYLYMR